MNPEFPEYVIIERKIDFIKKACLQLIREKSFITENQKLLEKVIKIEESIKHLEHLFNYFTTYFPDILESNEKKGSK